MLGELTKAIKEKHPEVLIQYHGHSGPGLSMASILEVCENGADIIDVAMEPMSWGKVHPDVISVQAMLKDKGFQVLGVATWDQPKDTKKAIEDLKITWPQILNAQNTPSELYGFNGIPHIILFGPDGTIVARDLRGDALKAKVKEMMQ